MKRNVNRLLSLVLVLVMLVGILPLTARPVEAEGESSNPLDTYKASLGSMTDVVYENNCDTVFPLVSNLGSASYSLDSAVSESGSDTSAKLAYNGQVTPQTYNKFDLGRKVVAGNVYTLRVWYKTSDSTIGRLIRLYQYSGSTAGATDGSFGENGHAQFYTSKADIVGNDVNGTEVILSMRATDTVDTNFIVFMLGAFGLTTDPAGSVWYDNVVITETWTLENALKHSKESIVLTEDADLTSFVQTDSGEAGVITISEGQTLDLNGHTLTANNITVVKGGKIIDSSKGEGRLKASLVCSADNSYLPIDMGDEGYLFVQPKMDDLYVKTSHDVNGFEIALRPGFGKYDGDKSVRNDILKNSNAGISLTVTVAWKDVYGQEGKQTVKAFSDEDFVKVYSSNTNKYFYTKFTNPGDSQYYDVTLSLVANGVTVSRTLHFDNLAEADKTYLFAHNFDGELTWSDKKLNSMRDDGTFITWGYVVPESIDNAIYFNGGSTANAIYTYGIPSHTADSNDVVVFEFKLKLAAGDSYTKSALDLMDIRSITGPSNNRLNLIWSNRSSSGKFFISSYTGKDGNAVSSSSSLTAAEDEWMTVKIVLDYGADTVSLTLGDETVSTANLPEFTASASTYTQIVRYAGHDHYGFDDMKLYVING